MNFALSFACGALIVLYLRIRWLLKKEREILSHLLKIALAQDKLLKQTLTDRAKAESFVDIEQTLRKIEKKK